MAVFAYLYFNNVVARQTVTVGYMLQKSLQLDGDHMLELFTKLGAHVCCHIRWPTRHRWSRQKRPDHSYRQLHHIAAS
jgi:hypothetical protein